MKRLLKIIIPSILMILLICFGRNNKDLILTNIYIIFPLIYILIGIINNKNELITSLILVSISFLIPINIFFNMGTCIDLVIIYIVLCIISYFVKLKIKSYKK